MTITLDATLQTAQDSVARVPIIRLTSIDPNESIPFVGVSITSLTNESEAKMLLASTGRLFFAYVYNAKLVYGFTDVDRTVWDNGNVVDTPVNAEAIECCAIVEMSDGRIGILFQGYDIHNVGNGYLLYQIVNSNGTITSGNSGQIKAFSGYKNYGLAVALIGSTYHYYRPAWSSGAKIYHATSSNFKTWGSETAISTGSLTTGGGNDFHDPNLFQPVNDKLVLVFSHVDVYSGTSGETTNLYYMTSADGSTWSTPTAITNNTGFSLAYYDPMLIQHTENQAMLVYRKDAPSLYMNNTATGWSQESKNAGQWADSCKMLLFDTVRRKILFLSCNEWPSQVTGATEIDLDTWICTDFWDATSVPQMPDIAMFDRLETYAQHNYKCYDSKYVYHMCSHHTAVIDPINNTAKIWTFFAADGLAQNVDWEPYSWPSQYEVRNVYVDDVNGRVYFFTVDGYAWHSSHMIGYIDIDDVGYPDPNDENVTRYTFTEALPRSGGFIDYDTDNGSITSFRVYKDSGFVIVSKTGIGTCAKILILAFDGDSLLQHALYQTWGNYGLGEFATQDSYLIGNNLYIVQVGNHNIKRFNIITETVDLVAIPPWDYTSSYDTYKEIVYDANLNAFLLPCFNGLSVYYIGDNSWVRYWNSIIPSLVPCNSQFVKAFYDVVNDTFTCGLYGPDGAHGIVTFPRSGKFSMIEYSNATNSGDIWTFETASQLVSDVTATGCSVAYVPDSNAFYAVWSNYVAEDNTYSLMWDKQEENYDLSSMIVRETPITIDRSIDGTPAKLSFSLANGHLFDFFNINSLLRPYCEKGRKLHVEFGDRVGGVDYLISQGDYYVSTRKIKYTKGSGPIIEISAEDLLSQFKNIHVYATEYYTSLPLSTILKDLVETFAGVDINTEVNLSEMVDDPTINAQFMDQSLYDILYTLSWRYGYMPRIDMDGKFSVFPVVSTTIDHVYSDTTKILNFSPNDEYNDLTNKVTVTGIAEEQTEVIYEEEMVAQLSGTIGWWGCKETYDIYYSEDREKRVRFPRLKVVASAEPIPLALAGGVHESIDYEDPEERYCVVKVTSPNLIPALIAAITGVLAGGEIPDIAPTTGGPTIIVGRRVEAISIVAALQILGSMANFQYEIWGQPVGYLDRELQSSVEDTANIAYMGRVFEKTTEGWNCKTELDCLDVANRELDIIKYQRNRVELEKITHLQDEEGDTISVLHPISNQVLNIYVTNLTRVITVGDRGSFEDKINGWIL